MTTRKQIKSRRNNKSKRSYTKKYKRSHKRTKRCPICNCNCSPRCKCKSMRKRKNMRGG